MRVTVKEISQRLASNAERVAMMLFPQGKVHAGMLEVGGVNGHAGKSLKVHLDGTLVGRWKDWAGDEGGDLLDLWAETKSLSLPGAIEEAKRWLGIRDEPLAVKSYAKPPAMHPELAANGKAMEWLTATRMIPAAIVNRFKVRGCAAIKAVVFPSYSPTGELINHSYRTLGTEKEVWQDKGCAPSLWGWQGVSEAIWEKREILICEGQIDAMSWATWGIDALSIPNGGGRTWIDYEWPNLEAFQTIYLSFDMDGKSDENLNETISRLGKHRCRVVRLPHKDANECLKSGATASQAREWVQSAQYVPIPHLVSPSRFTDKVLERFFPKGNDEGFTFDLFTHRRKEKTFRFRNGELTLWTGTTSHGKSTLLNGTAMILAFLRSEPALLVSLETMPPEVIYRLVRGHCSEHTEKKIRETCAKMDEWIYFYDKIGHIGEDELFDLLAYAHARHGVRDIVVDSLMRIDGMEEDYPRQTAFVIRCVTFARETGCHIHLVAHPRKSAGDASPRSQDISGSGNLRNNADNVLALWRNLEKERKVEDGQSCDEPDAVLSVEKDRHSGEFRKFAMGYQASTFRFFPWTPEPPA